MSQSRASRQPSSTSIHELWLTIRRHRKMFALIVGSSLVACLIYCMVASNVYEATARVALRGSTLSVLTHEPATSGSFASGQVQLETLASVFRSDQLGWDVISRLKLYAVPEFNNSFKRKYPSFNATQPDPEARAFLLDEFQRKLTVQTIPRTLVLQIRFRSQDAALSAAVVNALIEAFCRQDENARKQATQDATTWLTTQLVALKTRTDDDDRKLTDFQRQHGMLNIPETLANGQRTDVEHAAQLGEIDVLSRELVTATTDRIVSEAEYRSAVAGDPELVLASNPRLQATGNFMSALLVQLRTRRSDLEQEQAQLRIEHGPNFPRVVEIRSQIEDLDSQIKAEDAKLLERFRSSWRTASDREQLVRKSLRDATDTGLKMNEAALKYAVMRQEANANHDMYVRVSQQMEEAGLAAGSQGSEISIIDYARQPVEAYSPDLLVDMAITLFVSLWMALAVVLLSESLSLRIAQAAVLILLVAITVGMSRAQAPTPSTSGLPTGVARIPQSTETRSQPNAKDAPSVWESPQGTTLAGVLPGANAPSTVPMAALIAPGDLLEVSEAHSPDMRGSVRVSETGTVTLTLAGDVEVGGMGETTAAHAIERALIDRGMLLHPQVTVLVRAYAGQDVSILGEVARPGIYTYTVHHCLLDLISMASGLTANAGRLVTIAHRNEPKTFLPVVLDPTGGDTSTNHNPELLPGDTVQVSRAGLVYVVGDVVRPGGFPVDPVQTTTVVQALSLAWGPAQNAALTKGMLIREQQGSRTITTLNLKRMLRGLDPDIPIRDRDILFVPDSMAKNLLNRTIESAIQSAVGVSIYAGMVYSQRF
ncbi:SLBB domain-containing protein [Telmatobacter sp. DSM 110680]|uniref:SLBB domain-containing protein n=1 Tax=Telmatobacter sp. DSM 110680 TaxID=3036704 RepID=A0AAU7DEU7_9BACT